MALKNIKKKEVVKLRQRALANGNVSLFLDINWKGDREYDFLRLYLVDAKTTIEREQNKNTLLLAEQIRAQRLLDLQSGKYKIHFSKEQESFTDFFNECVMSRTDSDGNHGNWRSAQNHLASFTNNKNVTFFEVDEDFLMRFKHFLLTALINRGNKKLARNSALSYFNKVKAALREAFEARKINENPAERVTGIKQGETHRESLSALELTALAQTACELPILKRAFMFSALTGMRWGDIEAMTWFQVRGNDIEGWYIFFQHEKTEGYDEHPISEAARKLIGEQKESSEKVFRGLKYSAWTNLKLAQWVMRAGITKDITFHGARHTYATLLLENGVDILIVSKLLGHQQLKTTQIYTKVLKNTKRKALEKFPTLPDISI